MTLLNLPIHFPVSFQRSDINLEGSIEAASLLEPYYKPCKAKQYLEHTDEARWVTILRHSLDIYGYEILSQETTRDKKKTIIYTISLRKGATNAEIHLVEFN
jgi:N-acetyl-anhydromuramyl-L-alanine amidase AmpD